MLKDTHKQPRTLLHCLIVGALAASGGAPALMSSAHAQTATSTAPTLLIGTNKVQASVDTNPSGMAEAFQFYSTTTGTADTLNVYLDASNTATRVTNTEVRRHCWHPY